MSAAAPPAPRRPPPRLPRSILHLFASAAALALPSAVDAASASFARVGGRRSLFAATTTSSLSSSPSSVDEKTVEETETEPKPCFYLKEGRWTPRKRLSDLTVGQRLFGRKLPKDLLDGVTGPKVFFECGVGRIDSRGNWQIVNGMLRLGKRGAKKSVAKKRAARLKGKLVELYVSRIRLSSGHLEVSTSPEQVEEIASLPPKIPASTLTPAQELVGTVVRIDPYGVLVDVNANRLGLLHVQKVADLNGRYIDKEKGLVESGLEKGAKIRVSVAENRGKRLFLDFTEDVKEEAWRTREEREESASAAAESAVVAAGDAAAVEAREPSASGAAVDDEEEDDLADWAAFAAADGYYDEYDDDFYSSGADDDERDEDSDIEDALGIGSY